MYSMRNLTRRQQQIVEFLGEFQQARGMMPTAQEIAARFGFRSPNAVTSHLRLLQKKGVLAASREGPVPAPHLAAPATPAAVQDIPVFGSIPAGFAEPREQKAEGASRWT